MEILVGLFGLLFVLGIMAVIGHGIWLLVAAIFRAIFGAPDQKPVELRIRCVECGASLGVADDFCAACGRWQKKPTDAGPLADLAMTARQLDRLLNQGKLDPETHRRVMAAIEEERERLTAPMRPQPATAPVGESPPSAIVVQPVVPNEESEKAEINPSFDPSPAFSSRVDAMIQHEPAQQESASVPPQSHTRPEPRRSLTEMLGTFMEESSIRWGELIGGLLIIGCSIALVISLWSQIKSDPLLKFSVFVGMTAGLFGMGFYSAHRWKLPNTSRAALMISTLLVPLNFLAMAAFSQSASPNSPIIIGGELLALLLFLFLVYQAGNVIVPGNSWLLTGATLAPSFAMLLAKHWHETHVATLSLSLAPMIAYWISTGVMLRGAKEDDEEGDREADRIFTLLGIASFATALPVGLLLIKSGNVANSLHTFAPFIALFGVPAIASGLTLIRTKTGLSGKARTAATSIAIFGAMLAMAGLVFAWPWPLTMIGVALLNSLICAAIAWRFDLKLAHFAAIVFFALAYLIGANVLAGDFPSWSEDGARLINAFTSRTSGLAWMSLFVLFGVAAEAWRRAERKTESRLYELSAFCAAFFSLVLLTWRGWAHAGDPQHLALVYLFFAVAAFTIAWYRNRWIASWIGLCLSLLAVVQAFVFKFGYTLAPHHPARLSLLVYASLATAAAIVLNRAGEKARRIFARPLTSAALLSSIAVAPFLLLGGWMTVGQISARMLWLAAIWLVLSVMNRWQVLFTAFQAALSVGVVCGVAAIFDSRALPSYSSWLDPHLLQAEGIALALLSLSWLLLRISVRRADAKQGAFERLLYPSWLTVDHVGTVVAWGVLVVLSFGVFGDGFLKAVTPFGSSDTFAVCAQDFGSWLLLLALAMVFVVSLWEQFRKRSVLAMMTLLACACLLAAGHWRTSDSMLLSLRWLLVAGFAAVALPIIFRGKIARACERFRWPQIEERAKGLASQARAASLALFAAPALAFTAILFLFASPNEFETISSKAFFLAPLVAISLTLAAYAVRERSAVYAFASGLMLNLAATLGGLLGNAKPVPIIQANLITSAIFSLLWLAVSRRLERGEAETLPSPNWLLRAQISFTLLAALLLLAVVDVRLLVDPRNPSQMAASMGGVWGWLTILLPAVSFARLRGWRFERLRVDSLGIVLLAVVSLIGCSVSLVASSWTVLHALIVGTATASWLMLALCWKREAVFRRFQLQGTDTSAGWTLGLGLAQFFITVRGLEASGDAGWTIGSFAALCLLLTGLAIVTRHRGYVYLSGLLIPLVVTRFAFWSHPASGSPLNLALINVIALCLFALVWLKLDLVFMRPGKAGALPPFHRVVVRIAIAVVTFIAIFHWVVSLAGDGSNVLLDWLTLASLVALLIGCLWNDETDLSWRGLYVVGLIVIGKTFVALHWGNHRLLASTVAAFSLYALAATLLWRKREALVWLANAVGIPRRAEVFERMWGWLTKGNALITAFVAFCCLLMVFDAASLKHRLLATTTAFALPMAFALLARGQWRQQLILVSIRLCLLNMVLWSWAWLTPGSGVQVINRLVIVMLIAEAVLIAYRLIVGIRIPPEGKLSAGTEWRQGVRDQLWWIAVVGLSSLTLVLGVELSNYSIFGVGLTGVPVIAAVLVTLVGLVFLGLAFAVLPGEDPFGLNERGRMRYVYAAEGFVVLTLMHVRVTMPWLFGGTFTRYWPLLVMVIAFAGIGLSELFRRQGKTVLAEPLERSGIFLPLLPVIGFWASGSQVSYSMLLLLVGLFYGWLSVIRRSFGFGLLAALAGNGGLWHFLHGKTGFGFSEHPQLWLIPAALSVLLATRINRDSLSAEQMSSIRYGALIVIYVSSTADIFLNGVDDSPWLPIVLAILSVCGVMTGIMLRIRSFLFLGTAFLLLSMLTMIWSASVNLKWTWLWYVMGIALGVFIIYTFAMFERKREEMLAFVARLKQWE